MRKCVALAIAVAATGVQIAACGPRAVHTPATPLAFDVARLELVGSYALPAVDALRSARPGGVSGLAVDPTTKEIIGISDDQQDNRVFIFETNTPGTPFQVNLRAYFPLPLGPDAPPAQDSEGIALTRASHMFISSEGLPRHEPRVQPAIVEYTRRVDYVGRLTIPSKFLQPVSGPLNHGVRENEGFESLTITPDEGRLFTASETSLAQDGERPTFTQGTTARLLELVSEGGQFVARREFPYPLGPVPRVEFTPQFMINGLVELLALSDTEFLSMERAYAEEAGDNGRRATFIKIFRVSLDDATDISAMESIRGRSGLRPVRKRLLLDVNAVKGLPPELDVPAFDNFEGMCFGPTLPDGSRTLLIVSDDNFSPRERTWFLLFRILQ